MKQYLKVLVLAGVAATLVGCATPKMNLSTPVETKYAPTPDKALVYFIRPNKVGFAIHAAVYDDESFVGMVPYNQKLPYLADPGKHRFMVVSEAADFLDADLLPSKTYYIQVVPRMGAWRARFSLAAVTKEDLQDPKMQKFISNARLIENNQKAYEWEKNNHGSVVKKKAKYLPKWESKPAKDQPVLKATDCE